MASRDSPGSDKIGNVTYVGIPVKLPVYLGDLVLAGGLPENAPVQSEQLCDEHVEALFKALELESARGELPVGCDNHRFPGELAPTAQEQGLDGKVRLKKAVQIHQIIVGVPQETPQPRKGLGGGGKVSCFSLAYEAPRINGTPE